MGFMETLWGETRPAEEWKESGIPLKVTLRFAPLRLSGMRPGRVDLVVGIQNLSDQAQLVSVDSLLPKTALVGFDATCIHKNLENRVGQLEARQYREVHVTIWSNNQTKAGEYPVEVHVYSHYLDYNKVIHYLKKTATLRVV